MSVTQPDAITPLLDELDRSTARALMQETNRAKHIDLMRMRSLTNQLRTALGLPSAGPDNQ